MGKIVYQLNWEGIYIGPVKADPSPLEPGVWLIPGGCVEIAPPQIEPGKLARFTDGAWSLEDISEPETEPTPVEEQEPPELLSALLVEKFNELISQHLGQPYLTTEVISSISNILPAVLQTADNPALRIFSKASILTLVLPEEMQADKEEILSLFPQE